ncbi:histone deacetylase HDAC4 [Toxoplasma gondii GT1]|uniref:Histone deacetylase HDAC4 n=7 Tax=Toxoplasma gondii TaxID=5811 RepID=S7UZC5_TOXGG|nr:histone deacetylase HDAC4 [Toxoplasma gondii GT1]KAF4641401.1 histone deacetylase HDAC4 [Toxoplasma gondii]
MGHPPPWTASPLFFLLLFWHAPPSLVSSSLHAGHALHVHPAHNPSLPPLSLPSDRPGAAGDGQTGASLVHNARAALPLCASRVFAGGALQPSTAVPPRTQPLHRCARRYAPSGRLLLKPRLGLKALPIHEVAEGRAEQEDRARPPDPSVSGRTLTCVTLRTKETCNDADCGGLACRTGNATIAGRGARASDGRQPPTKQEGVFPVATSFRFSSRSLRSSTPLSRYLLSSSPSENKFEFHHFLSYTVTAELPTSAFTFVDAPQSLTSCADVWSHPCRAFVFFPLQRSRTSVGFSPSSHSIRPSPRRWFSSVNLCALRASFGSIASSCSSPVGPDHSSLTAVAITRSVRCFPSHSAPFPPSSSCDLLSASSPSHASLPACSASASSSSPPSRARPTVCLYVPRTHSPRPPRSVGSAASPSSGGPRVSQSEGTPSGPVDSPLSPTSRGSCSYSTPSVSCPGGLLLSLPSVSPVSLSASLRHFLVSYTSPFPARSLPLIFVDAGLSLASDASLHAARPVGLSQEHRETCASALGSLIDTAVASNALAQTSCECRPRGLPIVYSPRLVPPSFPRNHCLQPQKLGRLFSFLTHPSGASNLRTPESGVTKTWEAREAEIAKATSGVEGSHEFRWDYVTVHSDLRPKRLNSDHPVTKAGIGVGENRGREKNGEDGRPSEAGCEKSTSPSHALSPSASVPHGPVDATRQNGCGRDDPPRCTHPAGVQVTAGNELNRNPLLAGSHDQHMDSTRATLGTSVSSCFSLFSPIHDADVTRAWLRVVHAPEYVCAASAAVLSEEEERKIGFPVTKGYADKSLAEVSSTVLGTWLAFHFGLACVVGGGTHHAKTDSGGKFCVFNDVAVAAALALKQGIAERILILDLDVHQGDGTAEIFSNEPRVKTVSIHCEDNFPFPKAQSDVDIGLPAGTGDEVYLRQLNEVG